MGAGSRFGFKKWVLVILAGAVLGGGALTLRDEVLSEAAQRMLAPYRVDLADDNAFLHLVGLAAPAGSDNLAYARRWIETFLAARSMTEIKGRQEAFESRLALVGDKDELCAPNKSPCLSRVANKAGAWRQSLADNLELRRRAQVMTGLARFNEFYVPDSMASPLPEYKYVTQAQLLELSEIALAVRDGQLDSALAALAGRIAFDRRMLDGSHTLLGNMIASAMLRHDYRLLGEIVAAQRGRLAPWRARLLAMSTPLPLESCKAAIVRGLAGEAHMLANFLHGLRNSADDESDSDSRWYGRLLMTFGFRANATANLVARRFERARQRLDAFDPLRLAAFKAAEAADNKEFGEIVFSPRAAYNPLGKFMVAMNEQDMGSYLLRLTDTALISRAVRLQVLAALAGGSNDIPSLLAGDPALFDPYTGRPLAWDARTRILAVDLRGTQTRDLSPHLEFPM